MKTNEIVPLTTPYAVTTRDTWYLSSHLDVAILLTKTTFRRSVGSEGKKATYKPEDGPHGATRRFAVDARGLLVVKLNAYSLDSGIATEDQLAKLHEAAQLLGKAVANDDLDTLNGFGDTALAGLNRLSLDVVLPRNIKVDWATLVQRRVEDDRVRRHQAQTRAERTAQDWATLARIRALVGEPEQSRSGLVPHYTEGDTRLDIWGVDALDKLLRAYAAGVLEELVTSVEQEPVSAYALADIDPGQLVVRLEELRERAAELKKEI